MSLQDAFTAFLVVGIFAVLALSLILDRAERRYLRNYRQHHIFKQDNEWENLK